METIVYNQKGQETGKIKLPEAVFGVSWNADLVHQVVVSMMSSARHPIANTKTRGEIRGGGKKPWQQKGTGRARHGSTRSPIWVGGGVAHGPRADKNYDRKVNKKAKAKALYTILSKKFKDGEILFIDSLSFTEPKAAEAKNTLMAFSKIKGFEKFGTKPKNVAIITVEKKTPTLTKSFKNFGNLEVEEFRTINPVSVLNHKYLVIANPKESLKAFE
ncbi:MAG: large subunit ribosomal protein [Patescibacteria group bacterium]|nr:large subunit ribosomal protein [Patescibacteria group bacterium]